MKNTLSGKWAIDTNIIIYGLDKGSNFHKDSVNIFNKADTGLLEVYLTQQNLLEATNALFKAYKKPLNTINFHLNGLILDFKIVVLSPLPSTYQKFFHLLKSIKTPKDIYDTYLAATLLDNGINQILTANTKDFSDIKQIHAVNPYAG